jgi:hypothetical protein
MEGGKPGYNFQQIWNFPPYLSVANGDGIDFLSGFRDEDIVTRDNKIYTKDTNGPNVFLQNFSAASLNYLRYHGYKGELGYKGWYSPGIAGARYPKTDIYVEWKNQASSPLATLITTSADTADPAQTFDLSDGKEGRAAFGAAIDGANILFYANRQSGKIEDARINADAQIVLVVEAGGEIFGIATEAARLSVDGREIPCEAGNFAFKISEGGAEITPITVPKSFAWKENADGTMKPVYDSDVQEDILYSIERLHGTADKIYPVKNVLRPYMERRIANLPAELDAHLTVAANCVNVYNIRDMLEPVYRLFDKLEVYKASCANGAERNRIALVIEELREICRSKADGALSPGMFTDLVNAR